MLCATKSCGLPSYVHAYKISTTMLVPLQKLKRLVFSIPAGLTLMFIASCIAGIGLLVQARKAFSNETGATPTWMVVYVVLALVVGLAFLILQTALEFKRKTYDPTWALRYQEMWDQAEKLRSKAADILLRKKNDLSEIDKYEAQLCSIDNVLDILEDIGFYVEGDQISAEVAHHHFYHWIRLYWCAAHPYIRAWRKKPGEGARWSHIEPLFDKTSRIEASIEKCALEKTWLDSQKIQDFLEQECGEGSIPED